MEKLVSIIVPVYNGEKYIKNCIESLINQEYKNIEILIIDNGSIDNTKKIISSFSDVRIKKFFLNKKGVSIARNYGIERASGEYMYFVDADDYIEKNLVIDLIKIMEIKKVDFVMFNFKMIKKNETIINYLPVSNRILDNILIKKDIIPFLLSKGKKEKSIWGTVWRVFYKSSFLKNNKLRFNEKIIVAEDMLFVLESLLLAKNVYFFDGVLYNYNCNYNSTLNRYRPNNLEQNMYFHNALIKLLKKYNSYEEFETRYINNRIRLYTTSISNSVRAKKREDGIKEIKKICEEYNKDNILKNKKVIISFPIRVTMALIKYNKINILYYSFFLKEKIRIKKLNNKG